MIIPMLQMRKLRHREMKGWRDQVIQQGRSRAKHTVQDCRQPVLLPPLTAFHSESADFEIRGTFQIHKGALSSMYGDSCKWYKYPIGETLS